MFSKCVEAQMNHVRYLYVRVVVSYGINLIFEIQFRHFETAMPAAV